MLISRFQWPIGPTRGSAAACLLTLRFRLQPGAWATDRPLVQRSATECRVSVIEEPNRGGLDPARAVEP